MIIGAFTSLACQLGDLFFSYYKRKYGLKDYSKILGDHGGVLDRIDGLVISSIIFFIIINLWNTNL